MPRFNPYSLQRAAPVMGNREFTDPAQPGESFTLTLRSVNEAPFKLKVQAKAAEYVETYVAGRVRAAPKKPGELPRRDAPTPVYTRSKTGRQNIELDEQTCRAIGILDMLQVPDGEDLPLSFDEWAAMSVLMPSAFIEAANWAAEMLAGGPEGEDEIKSPEEAEGDENPSEAHTAA